MCHNSIVENEQIDKCIENGMPHKIIKTIKYTMRKRAANEEDREQKLLQQQSNTTDLVSKRNFQDPSITSTMADTKPATFISKCPFGHGRFSNSTSSPVTSTPAEIPSFTNLSSNNNNFKFPTILNDNFHQITQLSTNIAATTTTVGDNDSNNITNLSGHYDSSSSSKVPTGKEVYNDDILAKSTQLTKQFTYNMQQAIRRLQSSKTYTLLTKTTQPAHIAAICILSFVLLTVWPELIVGTSPAAAKQSQQQYHHHQQQQQHQPEQLLEITTTIRHSQDMSARKNDMLALIAYLGAFSTHFGAQIWMTFVSGLSLYFSLPRHMFGQCQQILFPKYFAMNAVLSITMLILYVKYFLTTWTLAKCIQLGSLAITGAIEVLVRLYLAPPLLRLMHEKYKIEGTIGSGKEIGSLVQGDLVQCPHYQRIHKAFRRVHMTVAIGNIITMLGSCLQLYYIAGQLQISIA